MKTFLIDFENVKSKGLSGIDKLTSDDHVIIFYSENSDTISFEMHCLVMQAKAQVDYIKVKVGGKNALDFQLSTLLGYLVAKGENTHLFIISNDKGFDKLHDFWENTFDDSPECKVFRTGTINAAVSYANYNKKPIEPVELDEPEQETEQFVQAEIRTQDVSEDVYTEAESAVEVEISKPDGTASSIDVPHTMIYSMIGSADLTENIAPKKRSSEEKPVRQQAAHSAQNARPARNEEFKKNAPQRDAKKQRTDNKAPAAKEKKAPNEPKKSLGLFELMPKMTLPGAPQPMITADESHIGMYEPMLDEFLANPEANDKHALLKTFMNSVSDPDIDVVKQYIIAASSKLELHNMLMKSFDNATSTRYYTMIKKHFYFLKRVLPEVKPVPEKKAEEKKPEPEAKPVPEKKAEEKKPEPEAKPAPEKKAEEKKPEPEAKPAPEKKAEEKKPEPEAKPAPEKKAEEKKPEPEVKPVPEKKAEEKKPEPEVKPVPEKKAEEKKPEPEVKPVPEKKAEEKKPEAEVKNETDDAKKVDAAMKKKLHELLDDKATADEFSGIISVMNASATSQQLYINLMQRYSRDRGRELYAIVKAEFAKFITNGEEGKKKTAKKAEEKTGKKPAKEKKSARSAKAEAKQETAEVKEKTKRTAAKKKKPEPEPVVIDDGAARLHELTDGMTDADRFDELAGYIVSSEGARKLYLTLIRKFGKAVGTNLYSVIKTEYEPLKNALSAEVNG